MFPSRLAFAMVLCSLGFSAGCSSNEVMSNARPVAKDPSTVIRPGPNVQEELQTALIKAKPGSIIELGEGTFEFSKELSLAVEKVTIRGSG